MMLSAGDFNLNRSVQAFGDSAMERLKQAMLQHEFVFRNQVCELHRLYWTQKNLMNELRMKGFDMHAPSSSSWLSKGTEEKKNAFSVSSRAKEMGNSVVQNVGSLNEFKGQSSDVLKNYLRDFSLHLPANDFIRGTSKDPAFYHQEIGVSEGNLIDNRGFGEVSVENSMRHSASIFRCNGVIDLEDSVELECNEGLNEVFSGGFGAPMQKGAGMLGIQPTVPCGQVSSRTIGNDMRRITSVIHMNEAHHVRLQEQKPALSYVGIDESCVDASVNHPRKKQQARPMLFDLNVPHEDDECSHELKGMLEQEKSNIFPEDTSFAHNPAFDTTEKTSCGNRASWLICNGEDSKAGCSLDSKLASNTTDNNSVTKYRFNSKVLTSDYQIQAECCEGSTNSSERAFVSINAVSIFSMELCKQGKDNIDSSTDRLRSLSHSDVKRLDSNITSSNSTNLPQTVNMDSVTKVANHEGSEEDTSSSHAISQDEVAPSRKFLNGCYSPNICRKNVCCSQDKTAGDPAAFSNTDDSVTTQLNSPQNDGSIIGKLKPEERDITVAAAAESLMGISLGCSVIPIEQHDGIQVLELESDNTSNLPQYSSDSFECMTLQLSEVQSEDHLIMHEQLSVNEAGKNERGLTLRRGRGFRDFQKEILPGLVTLSRQEICEDLHNVGYKLRRFITERNAKDNWLVPVRNRRSRLHSGRRRR